MRLSPLPLPSARARRQGGPVSPAYQVFEFCREAAVVGFFHVHDFRVRAQNVKFPGSESQEKKPTTYVTEGPEDEVGLNGTKGSLEAELTL